MFKRLCLFSLLFCVMVQATDISTPAYVYPQVSNGTNCCDYNPCYRPRWYFEIKPGYLYHTNNVMRQIFNNGGFSIRAEADYRFWGPLAFMLDGGYYQKTGTAIGGDEKVDIKLGSVTVGLKGIFFMGNYFAFYGSAGPRLFMMFIENHSPYVKRHDNKIGVGGGFTSGFLIFPGTRGFFFDLFLDYSIKKFNFSPNGISSLVFPVHLDSLTAGVGLGWRF